MTPSDQVHLSHSRVSSLWAKEDPKSISPCSTHLQLSHTSLAISYQNESFTISCTRTQARELRGSNPSPRPPNGNRALVITFSSIPNTSSSSLLSWWAPRGLTASHARGLRRVLRPRVTCSFIQHSSTPFCSEIRVECWDLRWHLEWKWLIKHLSLDGKFVL